MDGDTATTRGPCHSVALMAGGPSDLVFLKLLIEGVPADSQTPCCHFLVPVALLQNLLEQYSLIFQNGPPVRFRRSGGVCLGKRGGQV